MRENLEDDDDPSLITQKIWSHVKSKSNSHRIPECVSYKNCFKTNPQDQAKLFNQFFFSDQFSESSSYDITIDNHNHNQNPLFEIDFNHARIRKILLKINPNKAQGPMLSMVEF